MDPYRSKKSYKFLYTWDLPSSEGSLNPKKPVLRTKNILSLRELSRMELLSLLDAAEDVKKNPWLYKDALAGKTLAMIFQKPSTRTRLSFEVGMLELGGRAIYLRGDELQLGRGEALKDTALVMGRYVDAIMARVFRQEDLEELARYSEVPVINGLSDKWHPCQILADLQTIREKLGGFEGRRLAWIGDGNNVCNTLLIGCAKVGMDMVVACPRGYRPLEEALQEARKEAQASGSKIWIVEEPVEAVKGADVVYTDTFVSMGSEAEREDRLRTFLPKYRVTEDLMKEAKERAIFMHCLPAHRGEEVTDEVLDGPRSVVFDQAENRLHAQKALLYALLA